VKDIQRLARGRNLPGQVVLVCLEVAPPSQRDGPNLLRGKPTLPLAKESHPLQLSVVTPAIRAEAEREDRERRAHLLREPLQRRVIAFDPLPDEKSYTDWLARDIEATFECECMPPEIGNVIVPDVATNNCGLGEARIYDCLLVDGW
jgi:hypothetical protein